MKNNKVTTIVCSATLYDGNQNDEIIETHSKIKINGKSNNLINEFEIVTYTYKNDNPETIEKFHSIINEWKNKDEAMYANISDQHAYFKVIEIENGYQFEYYRNFEQLSLSNLKQLGILSKDIQEFNGFNYQKVIKIYRDDGHICLPE